MRTEQLESRIDDLKAEVLRWRVKYYSLKAGLEIGETCLVGYAHGLNKDWDDKDKKRPLWLPMRARHLVSYPTGLRISKP